MSIDGRYVVDAGSEFGTDFTDGTGDGVITHGRHCSRKGWASINLDREEAGSGSLRHLLWSDFIDFDIRVADVWPECRVVFILSVLRRHGIDVPDGRRTWRGILERSSGFF